MFHLIFQPPTMQTSLQTPLSGSPAQWAKRAPRRVLGLASLGLAALALAGCVVAPVQQPRQPRAPAAMPVPAQQAAVPQLPPLYFYPEQNQPEAQQERDRYECYRWAVGQTGFDPGMTPVRQAAPTVQPPSAGRVAPAPNGGEVAVSAATGAVVGAAVSSPRHAGQGAVLGALFGAMVGAASQEAQQRAHEHSRDEARARYAAQVQAAQAQAAQAQQPLHNFRRAMSACMEGRNYKVR